MDKVKVCLQKAKYGSITLRIVRLQEIGNRLRIYTENYLKDLVSIGSELVITRKDGDGFNTANIQKIKVVGIIDDNTIETNIPRYKRVGKLSTIHKKEDNVYQISVSEGLFVARDDIASILRVNGPDSFQMTAKTSTGSAVIIKDVMAKDIEWDEGYFYCSLTESEFLTLRDNDITIYSNVNGFYFVDTLGYCHLFDGDGSIITISIPTRDVHIPLMLTSDSDYENLNKATSIAKIYEEEFKSNIIPAIVNLEKVRYSPVIKSGTTFIDADKLSFNFHFRKRVLGEDWYIDSASTSSWFAFDNESDISEDADAYFESDLLGLLNFTDNDVRSGKNKLKKTFIRLSFYNSPDQMTQKLLYYSTIFLDSTELYSKYNYARNKYDISDGEIVMTDLGNNSLTSRVSVNGLTNTMKSSEGFFLYMFKDDAPISYDENAEKTIYMKVEFNHAGNGRTLPMLMWPKDEDGNSVALTVDNFFESLYIPVKLAYFKNRYVYYIESAYNRADRSINFVLFEPKLTVQSSQ